MSKGLRPLQHARLPSADTAAAAASTDADTRDGSRSTANTAVGQESCVQRIRRLQHARLPSTDTAAAGPTSENTRGGRSTVDTAVGQESCVQVLCHPCSTAVD